MTTGKSQGIVINDCDDVRVETNSVLGFDQAIVANRSTNLTISDNAIATAREISELFGRDVTAAQILSAVKAIRVAGAEGDAKLAVEVVKESKVWNFVKQIAPDALAIAVKALIKLIP